MPREDGDDGDQFGFCDPPCPDCRHCRVCGGSEVRGGPYGCTCEDVDSEEDEGWDERL